MLFLSLSLPFSPMSVSRCVYCPQVKPSTRVGRYHNVVRYHESSKKEDLASAVDFDAVLGMILRV